MSLQPRLVWLDVCRTFCVLGVLWIHTWSKYGNPAVTIGGVDINRPLAILGNGVDFFFVLSGFCMLMSLKNIFDSFTWAHYGTFIKKRWLRISPVYYVAATLIGLYSLGLNWDFVKSISVHFLYLQNEVPIREISFPFWSLGTEFQFYLFLPILLMSGRVNSIVRTIVIASLLIVVNLIVCKNSLETFKFLQPGILVRFPQFACGMLAYWMYAGKTRVSFKQGWIGFFCGVIVCFFGRVLMSQEMADAFGNWAALPIVLGPIFLAAGFALMVYNVLSFPVNERSMVLRPLTFIGQISFSFYVWHDIFLRESPYFTFFSNEGFNAYLNFAFVAVILTPAAWLSYRLLETIYLKSRARQLK